MISYGSTKFKHDTFIPITVSLFNQTQRQFNDFITDCWASSDLKTHFISCDNIPSNNPYLNGTCFKNQFCNNYCRGICHPPLF